MLKRPSDFTNRRAAQLRRFGREDTAPAPPRRTRVPAPAPPPPPTAIPLHRLRDLSQGWVLDAEIVMRSPRTIQERKDLREKLLWFLARESYERCGIDELKAFLGYVATTPTPENPRWGNAANCKNLQPVSPVTVKAYHRNLSCLFNAIWEDAGLPRSPMAKIEAPDVRQEQIQPFSQDQVQAILDAARRSYFPRRNLALVWFMLDTGARVSEVCDLRTCDVDFDGRRCWVDGKGRKRRLLPLGRPTLKALWSYQQNRTNPEAERFFVADQGPLAGLALTPNGVYQLVERLADSGGVKGVRASPHTFRHTFAIEFLRAGGTELALQELLGHESRAMVKRYVQLAHADIQRQHEMHSPADRLMNRRR